ncbi:Chitin synthase [Gurleya vavrai]
MSFFNLKYTCTEIELPFCRILHDTPTEFAGRTTKILKTNINTPYTCILLVSILMCTLRMLKSVNTHYSGVGRKEMKAFFYLYLFAISLDILLISNIIGIFGNDVYLIMTVLQLGIVCTSIFCLFVGSVTTVWMFTYARFSSTAVTRLLSAFYFVLIVPALYITLLQKNREIFCAIVFAANLFLLFSYMCFQLYMMRQIGSEVWAYGTLFIAFLFFCAGCVPLFFGCRYIAFLSERYLDGLFFLHLFFFCAIIMIHKFWLSICEDEVECTALLIRKERGKERFL